jgi:hypothetical protein
MQISNGHFDQHRMLSLIEDELKLAAMRGIRVRTIGHMKWVLEKRPGVDDLVEYEPRLNYILPEHKGPR